ncbi:TonB-dependent receptor [Janthinobacterium sp.]|uniref:TonB-dependent receptor n=1 Tax=Janthinobacterium sp. TaxID=1871054 RepID=UPI002DB669E2|nr:TonB-dependent receptor [Janthinobacterium sp.]HEU4816977.1 TonB-dependent receptor [Janthinobacterium sp.]
MMRNATGPLAATFPRPFMLKAAVAALAGIGLLSTASVWAQDAVAADASAEPAAEVAVVTVSGVRRSAQNSQQIKMRSDQVIDSIVADDIGKFPDNNVAETLARISGIQIRRDSGEASAVMIRGLRDVTTLLNGRELFTTTGRYVNLADIPATMLQRVDVYKSQGADQVEGGVAGIIDVRTNRPFDFKDFTASVNTRAVYSDKSKATDPNISGMVANRWKTGIGEVGALLGLSQQQHRYHEERAFNTAPVDKSFLSPGLTGPDQVGLLPIKGDRRRTTANAVLQWRPNADVELYAEGMATRFLLDAESDYFVGLPWWGTPVSATKIPGTNQLQTLTSTNVNTIMSTQANKNQTKTHQFAVGGLWDINPEWRFTSEVASTKSTYNWRNPILDAITVVPNATINTNQNGTLHVDYTGIDLQDPSNYYLKGFFDRYGKDQGSSNDVRADLAYTPGSGGIFKEISVGVRGVKREAESIKSFEGNAEAPDVSGAAFPFGRQSVTSIPGLNCLSESMSGGGPNYGLKQWYTPCASFLLNNTGTVRQAVTGSSAARAMDPGSFFKDTEKTYSIYTKAKVAFKLGAYPVDGTVGVRVVRTEQSLQGNTSEDGVYTPVISDTASTDVLPSVALKIKLRPDLVGRFAAGRTISRPGFSQLNPGVALVNSTETVKATGAGGNPNLKPVTGDNVDAALEWYFAPAGSVTATVFHHKFDGYIQQRIASETIGGKTYDVDRPYNTAAGKLQGLEIGYQQFYDGLPGILSGLGLQANGTYMSGTTDDETGSHAITGVSRYAYNLVLLYEKDAWSGRLAYNWRSKFIDSYNQGGPGLDLKVAPTAQLDGSLSYKINEQFTVTLDGNNLLDTKFKDYWNEPGVYARDTRRYDRTVGVSLRWKM